MFVAGEPVWATTLAFGPEAGEESYQADFPGTVIRVVGSKALVFIAKGAKARGDDYEFEPMGNGFCKIPLFRLSARDGLFEAICARCQLPGSMGHLEGYSCHYALKREFEKASTI
jgi:hypothetical protein